MDNTISFIAFSVLSFLAIAHHIWLGDLEIRVAKMERDKQLKEIEEGRKHG